MPIAAFVPSLDAVPEPVRPLYRPAAGSEGAEGFVLDVEPSGGLTLENTEALRRAVAEERKARAKAEAAAKQLEKLTAEGIDPASIPDRLARLAELERLDPVKEADKLAEARVAARLEKVQQTARAEREAAEARAERYRAALQRKTVEAAVDRALAGADVINPEAVKLKLQSAIRVLETDNDDEPFGLELLDGSGSPLLDSQGRPLDVAGYVQMLRADKSWAALFRPEGKAGAGVGQPGGVGSKVISRERFEAMNTMDRRAYLKAGGRIG